MRSPASPARRPRPLRPRRWPSRRLRWATLSVTAVLVGLAAIAAGAVSAGAADAPAGSAAPRLYAVDVVAKLGGHVAGARAGGVPVLLPSVYTSDLPASHLYGSGGSASGGYHLSIAAAPGCDDADACFVADFIARRGGRIYGSQAVSLSHGISGRIQPLACGASCSPPSVNWIEGGVLYTIQANVVSRKASLVSLADSAIEHGAR